MKKMMCLTVAMVCALALSACSGGNAGEEGSAASGQMEQAGADIEMAGDAANADASVGAADAAVAGDVADEAVSDDANGDAAEAEAAPWNIPLGTWQGYDRFSGEPVDGLTVTVYEVTEESIVFDYISPARAHRGLTAFLDASGYASYDIDSGNLILNITLSDNLIMIDEIEGLGAMAYDFKI